MAPPDDEDFRKGVEPLPEPRRVPLERPRPAPLPRETWRDERAAGSRNREPVLKRKVYPWLRLRDEVLAFTQAPAAHGGVGAVLVLLGT